MKSKKETDYRTVDPQAVYELKKVALRLRRKGKEVKEICEITGLADKTVRMAFDAYNAGGINAIKPKKRGRKVGEKRCIIANWSLNGSMPIKIKSRFSICRPIPRNTTRMNTSTTT